MAHIWAEVDADGAIGYARSQSEDLPGLPGMVQLFDDAGAPLTRTPHTDDLQEKRWRVNEQGGVERDHAAEAALEDAADIRQLTELHQRHQIISTMTADLGPNPPNLAQVEADIAEIRQRRTDRAALDLERIP